MKTQKFRAFYINLKIRLMAREYTDHIMGLLQPWYHFHSQGIDMYDYHGVRIVYQHAKYEKGAHRFFWQQFIQPHLAHDTREALERLANMVSPLAYEQEAYDLLIRLLTELYEKTFHTMQDIDLKLQIPQPDQPPPQPKDPTEFIEAMKQFLHACIQEQLETPLIDCPIGSSLPKTS